MTATSSRRRATPSQCLASVLRFLWGRHVNGSLRIETTGSRSAIEKPGPGSRHLHAGHRLGSLQGTPQTAPDGLTLHRFRPTHEASRRSLWMGPASNLRGLVCECVWGRADDHDAAYLRGRQRPVRADRHPPPRNIRCERDQATPIGATQRRRDGGCPRGVLTIRRHIEVELAREGAGT